MFLSITLHVYAAESYKTHLTKGKQYLDKNNFTEAIQEFSKALKMEPKHFECKKNLIYAYALRGDQYLKENKEYGKAANDYRSMLFYTLYFNFDLNSQELNTAIPVLLKYLNICEKELHFKKTAKNHFYTAKLLETAGEYPAAAYEYFQVLKSKKYSDESYKHVGKILVDLGIKFE